jgi:antitoxin CptB
LTAALLPDIAVTAALDELDVRRIRWRARRGLLENDLIITRFFERHAQDLDAEQVAALTRLLELPDNELLDLLLERTEPKAPLDTDADRLLLAQLRAC